MRSIHRDAHRNLVRAAASTTGRTQGELQGRHGECATLDRLLAGVRAGQSRVLVLRGEAGTGKTALLNHLVERAAGCRIAQAAGVESESELAFAGLHQLCAPFLDRMPCLPGPQRDALGTAFSLRNGAVPDRFTVGLAVLSLLSEVAREQPLICVADDVQWLDLASAQALGFVARHVAAVPVAVVLGVRPSGAGRALTGLAELVVHGLAEGDARALLEAVLVGPLDERVRDRIVAEADGNPRALLELALGVAPGELAGGFGLPRAVVVPAHIEDEFRRQLAPLPPTTRQLLLVAAAEPVGDPVLLWKAADRLGVAPDAAAPATASGLLELGGLVRFRHPLGRAAVYHAATRRERQRVHDALAEATDPAVDPDRRAWHRALAASGIDDEVADELERTAGRARERGGLAAAAAFAQRAAESTPDPTRRAGRALTAAEITHRAGAPEAALRLLSMALAGPLDELGQARAELLRARLAVGSERGCDAPSRLLAAGTRLQPLDPPLASEAYRDAFVGALSAGRFAAGGLPRVAEAVRSVPRGARHPRAGDRLLDGLAALATRGFAAGAPMVTRALDAFDRRDEDAEGDIDWLSFACRLARDVWDDRRWATLSSRLIERARRAGELTVLPHALTDAVAVRLLAGDRAAAARLADEAESVARATAAPVPPHGALLLAAWEGRELETRRLISDATPHMVARGDGRWLTTAAWATALLHNGRGRYQDALVAAEQGGEYAAELGLAGWCLVELIEAAARSGRPERAIGALQLLCEAARATGTDWALGLAARCRALVSDGEPAELGYLEAIDLLGRTVVRAELARAHLVYGEWLRRQGRRVDAREQLRTAHEMLRSAGADGFAERARHELAATGETVRKRIVQAVEELTAQEAQIARLAGAGRTNPEISTQLFISRRTVEWHLRKVFTKLGISSRHEIRDVLPDLDRAGLGA
jgi:DNA-binding CsgD family transcriptional regulator